MTSTSRPAARAATVLGLLAALALVGCGGGEGGQTRCADYALMADGDRADVVRDLLAEHGEQNPSDATVALTVSAVNYHCLAPDSADTPIDSILG